MVATSSGRRSSNNSSESGSNSKNGSNRSTKGKASYAVKGVKRKEIGSEAAEPRSPGRLRKYMQPGEGQEFDVDNRRTSEGRLADPQSSSWYVPDGREKWLEIKRSPGRSVRDLRQSDVGPFRSEDFHTKASDDRGHNRTLDVSMPEQVINELQAIIDANVFPVRNVKSLVRTLIVEGITTLHELARQHDLVIPKSHPQHIEQICRINRGMQMTLGYDDVLEQSCALIRAHRQRGYRNKARAALHETLASVQAIDVEEVRKRWLNDLRAEFNDLMRGAPAKQKLHARERVERDDDDDGVDFSEFMIDGE
jgi:hypothetical protein